MHRGLRSKRGCFGLASDLDVRVDALSLNNLGSTLHHEMTQPEVLTALIRSLVVLVLPMLQLAVFLVFSGCNQLTCCISAFRLAHECKF